MLGILNRLVLALAAVAFAAPVATATSRATHAQMRVEPNRTADAASATERVPAGDPLLGVVLIIGIVAFFILVAWWFSRISGSDDSRPADKSII